MPKGRTTLQQISGQFREMRHDYRQDYLVGDDSPYVRKRKGLFGSADAHLGDPSKFYRRIEVSRDLCRNESIVSQIFDRAVTNIVRDGFDYDPTTGDDKVDAILYRKFTDWSLDPDRCSEDGQSCFPDLEDQALWSFFQDGDILTHIPPEVEQVQFFEADEVRGSSWAKDGNVLGVKLAANRRRVSYSVVKPGAAVDKWRNYTLADLQTIPAYNGDGTPRCLHLINKAGRAKVTRGVPIIHAVLETIGQFGDIAFTHLVKQQMAASLVWEQRQTKPQTDGSGNVIGNTEDGDSADEIGREGLQPGTIRKSRYGEELHLHASSQPSGEAMQHLKVTLETIANAVGVPLIVLTMNPESGSFTTVRFCFDMAKLGFMKRQEWLERKFHRPIMQRNIRLWMREDETLRKAAAKLADPAMIFSHSWKKPGWPYPEPLKDAKADATQLDYYLNDPYSIASARNRDADDIRDRTIKYHGTVVEAAIREAARIKKAVKDEAGDVEIHWRDIANRASPTGQNVTDMIDETDGQNPPPAKSSAPKPAA